MKKLVSLAVASAVLASAGASASVSDQEFAQLKAQFAGMAKRLSTLEAENQQLRERSQGIVTIEDLAATNAEVASLKAQEKSTSWTETLIGAGPGKFSDPGPLSRLAEPS